MRYTSHIICMISYEKESLTSAIRVTTVIPREITTHDGSYPCSYSNTNPIIGKFL